MKKTPSVERLDPAAGGGAEKAPLLQALEAELERSLEELPKKTDPPPYFIAYEAVETDETTIRASGGALLTSDSSRSRTLDVEVRVGNRSLDSTHPQRGGNPFETLVALLGGVPIALPLEDDEAAIRAAAWHLTDQRYKKAVEALGKVKAQVAVRTAEEDKSPDLSEEPAETYLGAPARLAFNREALEKRVEVWSEPFRAHAEVLESEANLRTFVETRYFVNSEGTVVQAGSTRVLVYLTASTRADDGMDLQVYRVVYAETPDALPSDDAIRAKAEEAVKDLLALRAAPIAEPFTGPAILKGQAAGVFFHEVFGHRVEGHRQRKEEEGQTFAKKIGEKVMPAFVSVYDDPTLRTLNGTVLAGSYTFDDEGVRSQRATLVKDGVMKGFLMARKPARGFDKSNGHGRRHPGYTVVARQGNLVVEPSRSVTYARLKEMLIEEVKRQGQPYGLLFDDLQGGFTFTERAFPQAFKVLPIVVYRVRPDGREELVRGADIVGTPLSALSDIVAAADDYQTFNGVCGAESGGVPVSATSPSLLVRKIEIERKEKGSEKPPLLPPPETGQGR